jgi:hypothetical protein
LIISLICYAITIANMSQPESMLKNKSSTIANHSFRETCAMKEMLIFSVPTENIVAKIMTMELPSGERRDTLVQGLLYNIPSSVDQLLCTGIGFSYMYNSPDHGMELKYYPVVDEHIQKDTPPILQKQIMAASELTHHSCQLLVAIIDLNVFLKKNSFKNNHCMNIICQ